MILKTYQRHLLFMQLLGVRPYKRKKQGEPYIFFGTEYVKIIKRLIIQKNKDKFVNLLFFVCWECS